MICSLEGSYISVRHQLGLEATISTTTSSPRLTSIASESTMVLHILQVSSQSPSTCEPTDTATK
ncbi:hypothetical protein BDR05DRAFT_959310 [Suillus weaverae]|nr:hypothetical protein BDR05DRAFT_959310 [Suillus weaverae]